MYYGSACVLWVILSVAVSEKAIAVTFQKTFGEMTITTGGKVNKACAAFFRDNKTLVASAFDFFKEGLIFETCKVDVANVKFTHNANDIYEDVGVLKIDLYKEMERVVIITLCEAVENAEPLLDFDSNAIDNGLSLRLIAYAPNNSRIWSFINIVKGEKSPQSSWRKQVTPFSKGCYLKKVFSRYHEAYIKIKHLLRGGFLIFEAEKKPAKRYLAGILDMEESSSQDHRIEAKALAVSLYNHFIRQALVNKRGYKAGLIAENKKRSILHKNALKKKQTL